MTKRLLTLQDVRRVFPISYARASAAAREGILPVVRLGRQIFVDPDRLEEFIATGGKALPGGWKREAPVR
jgi:hypothetical protein